MTTQSLKPQRPLPKSEWQRLQKLTLFEQAARAKGFTRIAGVDEAGRGPLAGPVVAAACVIPEGLFFAGINDSKLLSPKKREELFHQMTEHPQVTFGVGIVDHQTIDRINILQATKEAMRLALSSLAEPAHYVLVDGRDSFTEMIPCETLIGGDGRSQAIAAASILAKITRDRLMIDYHALYPHYGFDEHKGYATLKHRQALEKFGPCPIHRHSFLKK